MSSKKTEQRAEGEGLLSTNKCLLPSLTFVSPIGRVRQREPGPVTSTPRVGATIRPDHICRSVSLSKLSDIREDAGLLPDEKEPAVKLFSSNNYASDNEKSDLNDPRLDENADRSRSILSTIASPMELEKKYRRQAAVTTNFHEKRKIAWGCTNLATCVVKSYLADSKASASTVEVNSTNNTSDMASIKIISADSTGELFKKDNEASISARDNSKAREVHAVVATNMLISTKANISSEAGIINNISCSSLPNEKENISISKDLLNEVEDVTAPIESTEDSIYISSVNSLTEISNKECIPITENKVAAVHASSPDDDIQIIDCVPLSRPFTAKPVQKIPEAFSRMELEAQLADLESLKRRADLSKLPDCGQRLLEKIKVLQEKLNSLNAFQSDKSITSNGTNLDYSAV
uniref:Uncharacterized protein n=1 Tax=Setaria digitata TaxID=48799 RepID=A0A915PV31_9BILA